MLAQFSCTGRACASPGQVQTEQFQYECNSDNTFTVAEISAGNVRTESPTATLQTPLNEACAQCVLSPLFPEAGPGDHCVRKFHVDNNRRIGEVLYYITFPFTPFTACLQRCTEGQIRCVGPDSQSQCCNWYLDGRCVVTCPGNLEGDTEPDTIYDCGKCFLR